MGSSKKRKEKAKDFAKAKLKLGKGKQKAANATDASFSARSIALGQQSIGKEHREGVPTTKRNLSLEDLQTQLKHYSANTRKDALAGLRELLSSYPEVANSSVSSLVPLLARLIGDEDASVRKALLVFLQWYLPGLPPVILEPHHSVLIFFMTSALSHIYPDVRLDAVRVLNLLLDVCRDSMVLDWMSNSAAGPSSGPAYQEQSHSQSVLDCYLALLHIRSGVATNGLRTDMSPASKALILSSLAKFLRLSLTPDGSQSMEDMQDVAVPEVPTWYLTNAFHDQQAYIAFVRRFHPDTVSQEHEQDGFTIAEVGTLRPGSAWALSEILSVADVLRPSSVVRQADATAVTSPSHLLTALLPIFVAAFLDSAPTAFAPGVASSNGASGTDLPLETVLSVTESARDLWRACLSGMSHEEDETSVPGALTASLEKLVGYMSTYFPFGSDELAKRPMSQEQQLERLNIAYCELVSLLHIYRSTQQKSSGANSKLSAQLQSVQTYVEQILGGASGVFGGSSLNAQLYVQLLPTIWALLSSPSVAREAVLETVVRHSIGLSATSGVKKISTGFLVRLVQDVPSYSNAFPLRLLAKQPTIKACLQDWLLSLPRYLWELAAKDEATSQLIIDHLRFCAIAEAIPDSALSKLQAFLAPYFHSTHSSRGEILGPFTRLSSRTLQVRALEMAWWLSKDIQAGGRTLREAVSKAIACCSDPELAGTWKKLSIV